MTYHVNLPVEAPDEENNEAVRHRGSSVTSGEELQEYSDENPKSCHHNESSKQRLAATKTIDRV